MAANTATTTVSNSCKCGCKGLVPEGTNYKPGHDARHAGDIARRILDGQPRDKMLAALPTDRLQAKAATLADRWIAQADEKVKKAAERHAAKQLRDQEKKVAEANKTNEPNAARLQMELDAMKAASEVAMEKDMDKAVAKTSRTQKQAK